MYKIRLSQRPVWIPEKFLEVENSKSCSTVGKSVYVETEVVARTRIQEGRTDSMVVERGLYPVVSVIPGADGEYFRISSSERDAYVSRNQVVFNYTPDQEEIAKKGMYSLLGFPLLFGAGYSMNQDEGDYSSLITAIPDEDDVSPLQDPLIRSVERGSGLSLGVSTYFPVSGNLEGYLGFNYRELTFRYKALENPEYLTPTSLSQLDSEVSGELKQKSLVIEAGGLYSTSVFGLPILLGPMVDIIYNYEGAPSVTVRQGCTGPCLGKREPLEIQSSVSEWDYELGARLGYRYKKLNLSLDVNSDLGVKLNLAYRLF